MTVDTGECLESGSRTPFGVRLSHFSWSLGLSQPGAYLLLAGFFAALALDAAAGLLAVFFVSAALPLDSFFR